MRLDGKIEIAYGSNGEKMVLNVNEEDGKYAAVVKVNSSEPITVTLKKEGTAFNSSVINFNSLCNSWAELSEVLLTILIDKLLSVSI